MSSSLQPYGLQPPFVLCPTDSPGKDTGAVCHFLLPGFIPTQGSNPCLLHWQAGSSPLNPFSKQKMLYHIASVGKVSPRETPVHCQAHLVSAAAATGPNQGALRGLRKETRNASYLAGIGLQPLLSGQFEETWDGYLPQIAEVYIKRRISMSPDYCIFTY